MNILLSFLQDTVNTPHAIPAYRFWSYYIKNGIEEAGMSWLEVPGADWAEGLVYNNDTHENKNWRDNTWQKTIDYIKVNPGKIDVFLCYLHPKQIDVNAINHIRKMGVPCVNFYCDNIREFTRVPDKFKAFNLIWVPEYEAITMYKQANINYINLPMPMWVDKKYRDSRITDEKSIISFIGSKDIYRNQLLGDVLNKGLDINIRGNGWGQNQNNVPTSNIYQKILNQLRFIKKHGANALVIKALQKTKKMNLVSVNPEFIYPMPDFDEYIKITQNSAITLGINRVPTFKRLHTNPLVYSRLRDIEAPMLGACYLTEYCEGLNELYDLEEDIATYKTPAQLYDKAKRLLNDEKKRTQLRANGQHKALTQLSIPVTLNKLKKNLF